MSEGRVFSDVSGTNTYLYLALNGFANNGLSSVPPKCTTLCTSKGCQVSPSGGTAAGWYPHCTSSCVWLYLRTPLRAPPYPSTDLQDHDITDSSLVHNKHPQAKQDNSASCRFPFGLFYHEHTYPITHPEALRLIEQTSSSSPFVFFFSSEAGLRLACHRDMAPVRASPTSSSNTYGLPLA
ncbi:hypothetical protein SODALDRAFT_358860 [Sodiomyces alkalinus F11]|uniref:Uncharacterized protein n=1 Tax=Sodiomyces alkalinus (strain CBS 110278 / VKM F-3762 / F11) TaxID=1314773 RepID=A0A3N2PXD9_SODAK|nr:hypothetical protein SODALDRAFT_358860 [Sodiomyces alkalinus F11]ROT39015.1 hypothetical protein SODALDRAFT_358860 [Sodiomyces alkalinus F11]